MFWKKKNKTNLGKEGEEAAREYLKGKGYAILENNFSNPKGRRLGEIDIIAQEEDEIVFVEVKTRRFTGRSDNLPEESINRAKLHKLNKISNFYIRIKNKWNASYRFDAISVWTDDVGEVSEIRHLKNIFF